MTSPDVMLRKVLILLFSIVHFSGVAQNLYDLENSLRYAAFLSDTRKYDLAAEEYERILFLSPNNDSIKHLLLRNYILDGDFEKAIARTNSLFENKLTVPRDIALDFTYAMILSGNVHESSLYITNATSLLEIDRNFLTLNRQLLSYELKNARQTYSQSSIPFPEYESLLADIDKIKHKNYAVAVGLSAILPGSGKAYTGQWKDGLISLVFISGFTIQAIRGYNTYGSKSAHFIGYASLASVFYLSNLYGTYKSVKKYNESSREKFLNRAKSTFISTL